MKWLQWSIQQLISDAFICLLTTDSTLLMVFSRQVSPLQTKRSNLRTLYNPTLPGGAALPGSDGSWALRSNLLFETFRRLSASSICKCSTVSASRLGGGPVILPHTLLANPPLPLLVMVKITSLWNLTDCTCSFSLFFFACHLHSPSLFIYSRALSGRRSRLMILSTPTGLLRQVAELCLHAIKKAGLSGSV